MFVNQLLLRAGGPHTMLDCAPMDAPAGARDRASSRPRRSSPNPLRRLKIMTQLTLSEDKYKIFKVVDTQYGGDDAKS